MSAMSPIVGISKIIGQYSTVVAGFDGVIYDGKTINKEAVKALANARSLGKNVILFSNTDMPIIEVVKILKLQGIPLKIFSLIMTAGEIVYSMLQSKKNSKFGGKKYFCVGSNKNNYILEKTGYEQVSDINNADFIFVGGLEDENQTLAQYRDIMQIGATLNLPMLCAGNDLFIHINGEVCNGCGSFAEQYAIMGGKIITVGKPDIALLRYVLESFSCAKEDLLIIGDNLQTDIKMANLYDTDSLFITKGIHKEMLGEAYIPDLQKVKDLSADYGVYPKYIISELRW